MEARTGSIPTFSSPAPPAMPPTKTQRWLDLIAVLLGRRIPVSVDFLFREVPAYRADLDAVADADEATRARTLAAVRRKFERDKAELRRLGIVLETAPLPLASGESGEGYRIPAAGFYLPLLRVVAGASPATGSATRSSLELAEEEARTALTALRRILELPSFPFHREARTALRKLTFDLDPALDEDLPVRVLERAGGSDPARVLPLLMDALLDRKRVRFRYRSPRDPTPDPPRVRQVEPWGLFFQWGGWYLLGNDPARTPPVRLYRVDRMLDATRNGVRPGTPDFERDPEFDVTRWMDRSAWELGEGEGENESVEVRFLPPLDRLARRNGWGEPTGSESVRVFRVRRRAPLLRWVLSHAGEAEVVAPEEAVGAFRDLARRIARRHGEAEEAT